MRLEDIMCVWMMTKIVSFISGVPKKKESVSLLVTGQQKSTQVRCHRAWRLELFLSGGSVIKVLQQRRIVKWKFIPLVCFIDGSDFSSYFFYKILRFFFFFEVIVLFLSFYPFFHLTHFSWSYRLIPSFDFEQFVVIMLRINLREFLYSEGSL